MTWTVVFESLLGLVLSVIGFLLFYGIYALSEMLGMEIEFWGDKAGVFFGLFFGLSIGGAIGVFIAEKLLRKGHHGIAVPVGSALFAGLLGTWTGVMMLDSLGGAFILALPFMVSLMCVAGYNIGLVFISKK